ncbi:MAG: GNAT family N-acetyltransferase, partial [Theionarchaea archaeon]|nr:GNAT family N-acetyltransferase [Theionarchaea archaeon]
MYRRFISQRKDMPHERLQDFVIIDYTREMVILAVIQEEEKEEVVGVGTELVTYLTFLAKRRGLLGFTAEVLMENRPMLHLFEKMGFDIQKRTDGGVYELRMAFRG